MSETKTVHCPHCNQPYAMTAEQERQYAGQLITCTVCQRPFSVGGVPPVIGQSPPAPPVVPAPVGATSPPRMDYAHPAQASKTDGFSIASLVCGCLICIPFLAGILATVFGIVGLKRTADPNVKGRGFAIAGLVLGILNLVGFLAYFILMISLMVPSLNRARETANRVKCASNMRQIGQALLLYAVENQGEYPPTLDELLLTQDITPHVFNCPTSAESPAPGETVEDQAANLSTGGHLSYVYLGSDTGSSSAADQIILYEPLTNHNGDGTNVLYGDGHVEFMSAQTFQTELASTKKRYHSTTPVGPEAD
jgi:prepilin-type processing-associated H-X9-DG protein